MKCKNEVQNASSALNSINELANIYAKKMKKVAKKQHLILF